MNGPEWEHGDTVQREWAALQAGMGGLVVPTHELRDNSPGTKAPMGWMAHDLVVLPDVLVFRGGAGRWHEVKAKSEPTWRRTLARWEHGIDHANLLEYVEVQRASAPVWLVVGERLSPVDPARVSPLVTVPRWLVVRLDTAVEVGEHRPTWPGGERGKDRGRRGRGGWLWPRSAMVEFCARHRSVSLPGLTPPCGCRAYRPNL